MCLKSRILWRYLFHTYNVHFVAFSECYSGGYQQILIKLISAYNKILLRDVSEKSNLLRVSFCPLKYPQNMLKIKFQIFFQKERCSTCQDLAVYTISSFNSKKKVFLIFEKVFTICKSLQHRRITSNVTNFRERKYYEALAISIFHQTLMFKINLITYLFRVGQPTFIYANSTVS